jgi:hypothetical protein
MQTGLESVQNFERKKYSQEILESACNEILNLDPGIRFAGIINNKGILLTGNKKKGMRDFLNSRDQEMILMETALGVRMGKGHDTRLGPARFIISYSNKVISMIFPMDDEILCVSAKNTIELVEIPFLILRLLETKFDKPENWAEQNV